MDPLLVALCGVIVVVGGVLALRLPAFLALVAGALLVALLTPHVRLYEQELRGKAFRVTVGGPSRLEFEAPRRPTPGRYAVLRRSTPDGGWQRISDVVVLESTTGAMERAAGEETPRAGDLIIQESDLRSVESVAQQGPGQRLARGFGDTCQKIGIMIAMASIIGACLLESGAAQRIVAATQSLLGERRAPLAFVVSGFVIGIPVFFDTVFYLLMPLAKALRLRTGRDYLLYILSVVVGATMAHSLVPPTPGPLFVATQMNVSVTAMMFGGTIVGAIAVVAGYLYALWANRRWVIPLRDDVSGAEAGLGGEADAGAGGDAGAATMPGPLPPLWLSLLPIVLPVVLLTAPTLVAWCVDALWIDATRWGRVVSLIELCGERNMALTLAAVVALATVAWRQSRGGCRIDIKGVAGPALSSGGMIVLITAAGGAFGHVLRQADVAYAIESRAPVSENGLGLLVLAFTITAAVRVAQGSATVAMMTAVGIVSPLAVGVSLPFHPVYLALAIGCGSKPLPWMNDSGFWVVGRMSGMTEAETLKTQSVMLTIMGFVGLLATLAGAYWFPAS